MAKLEHVNLTVRDPDKMAEALCDVFGWRVRWAGAAMSDGRSVHVGEEASYLALYRPGPGVTDGAPRHGPAGGMNHIGVVVDDLDAVEARAKAAGFETYSHDDYEPGRRFYMAGPEGIEIEVASYT